MPRACKLVIFQSEEDPEKTGEYTIEKILQKRKTSDGITEYYLKWKGWSDDGNTWQPAEEIGDPELVDEFEERESKKLKMVEEQQKQRRENPKAFRRKEIKIRKGFERGYSPEKIIGITAKYGDLSFLIKWKGVDDADMVPASEANKRCPELVIKFYESNSSLEEANEDNEKNKEQGSSAKENN